MLSEPAAETRGVGGFAPHQFELLAGSHHFGNRAMTDCFLALSLSNPATSPHEDTGGHAQARESEPPVPMYT